MVRNLAISLVVLMLSASVLQAEEVKGVLSEIDANKSTITITIPPLPGGAVVVKSHSFEIPKDAKIVDLNGKVIAMGLKDQRIKEKKAIVTVEKKAGKEVVTQLRILIDVEKK